ncbi:MAG TPA: pyridoxal phosphate-dependent aminotransferase [Kofleriaceae bacterium]|nr:pyridoxal phosphate-dependent aminotransferase [Kofleriaceae bacterium]
MLSTSHRAELILQSEIRNMSVECDRLGGINLSQGICDTPSPPAVLAGAHAAIDAGIHTYTRYDGLAELRGALSRKLAAYNKITANPDGEIIASAGSTGALYCTLLALLNPGDEVILFEPYYGYHLQTLLAVEAVPKFVTTHPPDWRFELADVERAIGPRTRAILVNTPSNPSGKVWTQAELEAIAQLARKHDLFIFTDEVYEYLTYDGRRHISPATIEIAADRTITIGSLSKTFSITGWRIGFAAAPPRLARTIGYMNDLVYVCAPAPLQAAAAHALDTLGPEFYEGLRTEYTHKRDRFCGALARAGFTPYVPQGAYYVLADVSKVRGGNAKERAMTLLREAGVAGVPGDAFFHGRDGDTLIRFCFAKTDALLDEACRRLEAWRG